MATEITKNYENAEQDNEGKCSFTFKDLGEHIKSLYLNKPYYGYTLSKMSRLLTPKTKTAAVQPTNMCLLVNPFFFEKLTKEERLAVLEHEVLHIGFFHYERYKVIELEDDKFKSDTWNVAADCAINQLIQNMPEGCITLEYVQKYTDETLTPKDTAEAYYKVLVNNQAYKKNYEENEELQNKIEEIKAPFDETFQDVSSASKSLFKRILRDAKKLQKKHEKKHGTESGWSLFDALPNYDGPIQKDIWKKLVDKAFGDEPVAKKDYVYGRPSRRNSGSMWYTKHCVESRSVYFGIDTSASIRDEDLDLMLGYAKKGMKRNNCTLTVIQCDTRITDVTKIKKASQLNKVKIYGRGGTDMTKILDYIEKHEKNPRNARLILLTDGYTGWRDSIVKTSVVYSPDSGGDYKKISPVYNSAVIGEERVVKGDDGEDD